MHEFNHSVIQKDAIFRGKDIFFVENGRFQRKTEIFRGKDVFFKENGSFFEVKCLNNVRKQAFCEVTLQFESIRYAPTHDHGGFFEKYFLNLLQGVQPVSFPLVPELSKHELEHFGVFAHF